MTSLSHACIRGIELPPFDPLNRRAALAERPGETITPEDLIITAGANHAFTLALTRLVDPGDEVILPAPYFTNHQMAR